MEVEVVEEIVQLYIENETIVLEAVAEQGPQGPPGAKGDKGDRGEAGASSVQEYDFAQPADVWHIIHNKDTIPDVYVLDTVGRLGEPWDITYPDRNSVTIQHSAPMSGKALLNF